MQDESTTIYLHDLPSRNNNSVLPRSHSIALGDLIIAVFDNAAGLSEDSEKVSKIAVQTVSYILRYARRQSVSAP